MSAFSLFSRLLSLILLAALTVPSRPAAAQGGPRAPESSSLEVYPTPSATEQPMAQTGDWTEWYRPVDNPVFTTEHGNNHDVMLFVEPEREYPYHLIVSHEPSGTDLWRTKSFSWDSAKWELVDGEYQIAGHYEYDDGVAVDGTYYIFEAGEVYTYSGDLEDASGEWEQAGTFPADRADDIGVFYEDGIFHIFGENGPFPHGPDGSQLSHFTSETGLGNWTLIREDAVDPNPDGGHTYGVGDPTIARIQGSYYIYCDRETKETPYRVTAWKSDDLDGEFEFLGVVIAPRSEETDDWDNQRIQDAEIGYVPELSRYVLLCNMRDLDGTPGNNGRFPTLDENETRVMGTFYSREQIPPEEVH